VRFVYAWTYLVQTSINRLASGYRLNILDIISPTSDCLHLRTWLSDKGKKHRRDVSRYRISVEWGGHIKPSQGSSFKSRGRIFQSVNLAVNEPLLRWVEIYPKSPAYILILSELQTQTTTSIARNLVKAQMSRFILLTRQVLNCHTFEGLQIQRSS
jgi:hypothetical protein